MKILEVNDIDLIGKVFNGYDIMEYINTNTKNCAKQIVVKKFSNNKNVIPFFKNDVGIQEWYELIQLEHDILSTHSLLSITTYFLKNHSCYKNSDLVHYHQLHNTQLNLTELYDLSFTKPTIISAHDPWLITGRCVHPGQCTKWKTGCSDCPNLNTLFDLNMDNCSYLWEIKKQAFEKMDVDILVASKYMYNLFKDSPLMKKQKIHFIPFGINLKKFDFSISKKQARKKLKINCDSIVLFFREQSALKGTEYIIDALENLDTDKKITLLTCGESGLLQSLKNKYKIIELGNVLEDEILLAFNACDIFLMPSKGESFGMMAIEAMAAGKPVIIFDNTALPDVTFAPQCGVLVKDKDADDLKNKILYLINNEEERLKRGKLGKKLTKEHYDINVYNQKIGDLYEKVYERQSYKLSNKKETSLKINYQLPDVQNLLIKLKDVSFNLFKSSDVNFDIFNEIDFSLISNRKIDYSLKEVQDLIVVFNEQIGRRIYEMNEKFDASINNSRFKDNKLYIYLKGHPKLWNFINYFRHLFQKVKILKVSKRELNDICKNLSSEIELLKYMNKELSKKMDCLLTLYTEMEVNNEKKS